MSYAKYSPTLTKEVKEVKEYKYNALGQVPPEYKVGDVYDEKVHFANYDEEGFDSYGYSAYVDGVYVGIGSGDDRDGYTEDDYVRIAAEEGFAW